MRIPGLFIIGFLVLFPSSGLTLKDADDQVGVEISAKPIGAFEPGDPARRRFGDLEFRGGLILASSNPSFGGFSALLVEPDGSHFIAVSDRGSWLRGRIAYEGNRPAAIADAVIAPVLTTEGRPTGRLDTESLAEDKGILYVGVERRNEILRFEYDKNGFLARGESLAVPPGIKDLPNNQGLEAMVFVPRQFPLGGTLIALSEKGLNEAGDIKAFLIGGPSPGVFAVKRTDEYDIGDAALLPGGDLLILERKYSLLSGVSVRMRRIPLASIQPGATVDGRIVVEADMRHVIDNLEALGVHRTASGAIVLTLMSDNNFSPLQRTLLLQFTLMETKSAE
jgi:hypothetical protein